MPILRIIAGERERTVVFSGTPTVRRALLDAEIPLAHPCGGRGVCGKCAVRISGELSAPTERERIPGYRLSCATRLLGDATVWMPSAEEIRTEGAETAAAAAAEGPLTGVFDLGTTTVALRILDRTGAAVAGGGALNPQRDVAADVIGRIAAAGTEGGRMRRMILDCMAGLYRKTIDEMNAARGTAFPAEPEGAQIVTGNTTMLYLLTGTDPAELGRAPFDAGRRFDGTVDLPWGGAYLPPCVSAFAGADLMCAVLASGMTERSEPSLLCDAGTNGEIALWDGETLWVTSAAAGPAFEGVGIRNGCMSVPGAICRVRPVNSALHADTVDGLPAAGLCGSGVLDAVAAGLYRGDIDETGYMPGPMPLRDGICLYPEDTRAVQLAKAAVAAAIAVLTEKAGVGAGEIGAWYLCGGFGSHLDPASAVAVGLLPPEARGRTEALGNAALDGACRLIRETEKENLRRIVTRTQRVALGGDPAFNRAYMEHMSFPRGDAG